MLCHVVEHRQSDRYGWLKGVAIDIMESSCMPRLRILVEVVMLQTLMGRGGEDETWLLGHFCFNENVETFALFSMGVKIISGGSKFYNRI